MMQIQRAMTNDAMPHRYSYLLYNLLLKLRADLHWRYLHAVIMASQRLALFSYISSVEETTHIVNGVALCE